jgi:hypothetical protein
MLVTATLPKRPVPSARPLPMEPPVRPADLDLELLRRIVALLRGLP